MSAALSIQELPELFQAQVGPRLGLRLSLLAVIPRWLQLAVSANLAARLLRHDARDMLNTALWMESVVQHIDQHSRGDYIDQHGGMSNRLTAIEAKLDALLEVLAAFAPKHRALATSVTMLTESALEFRSQVRQLRSAVLCHDADVDAARLAQQRRAAAISGTAHSDLNSLG